MGTVQYFGHIFDSLWKNKNDRLA